MIRCPVCQKASRIPANTEPTANSASPPVPAQPILPARQLPASAAPASAELARKHEQQMAKLAHSRRHWRVSAIGIGMVLGRLIGEEAFTPFIHQLLAQADRLGDLPKHQIEEMLRPMCKEAADAFAARIVDAYAKPTAIENAEDQPAPAIETPPT